MKLSTLLVLLCSLLSVRVYADSTSINTFINASRTPTYDCPDESLAGPVTAYLEQENLTPTQQIALTTMQTHGQICNGNNATAEKTLLAILDLPELDKESRHYAVVLYQLGFIYDVQASPKRCDYYAQALALAENRFADISLSATLGLITECESNTDDGVRLGKLFTLLEQYSTKNELGAVAHIHNHIGLLFGTLGQHVLAAEQYIKAHRIGLDIYTGSNQLSILISAITSYLASGNYEQAEAAIDEFRTINQNVNTPLTNFWLLFAEAGYYYRTEQYQPLRQSIIAWDAMKKQINSVTYTNLFRWYAAVLCLAEEDAECLRAFLAEEQQTSAGYQAFVRKNKDYLRFITDVHFFLGDIQQAEQAYELLADTLFAGIRADQDSGRIMGIANLYAQINSLESRLEQSKQQRDQIIIFGGILTSLLLGIVIYFFRKRRLAQAEIDPVSQLLNNRTALRRIETIDKPTSGKTNALAIFDIGNFREVNRLVGSTKADFVLKQIAETLQEVTRSTDILGRFAPEQFILCLPDIEEETAKMLFERIRQALEDTSLSDDNNTMISVRSSMSVYISSEKFSDLSDILDDMSRSLSIQN